MQGSGGDSDVLVHTEEQIRVRPSPWVHSVDPQGRDTAARRVRIVAAGACCIAVLTFFLALTSHSHGTERVLAEQYSYGQRCNGCMPSMMSLSEMPASMTGLRAIYHSANGHGDEQGLYAGSSSLRAPSFYREKRKIAAIAAPIVATQTTFEEQSPQEGGSDDDTPQMYYGGSDEVPYVQMPPSRISGEDGHVMWTPNECDDADHPCERKWVWTDERPHRPLITTEFPVANYVPTTTYPYIRGPFKHYQVGNEGNMYDKNRGGHWVWVSDKDVQEKPRPLYSGPRGEVDDQGRYPQDG